MQGLWCVYVYSVFTMCLCLQCVYAYNVFTMCLCLQYVYNVFMLTICLQCVYVYNLFMLTMCLQCGYVYNMFTKTIQFINAILDIAIWTRLIWPIYLNGLVMVESVYMFTEEASLSSSNGLYIYNMFTMVCVYKLFTTWIQCFHNVFIMFYNRSVLQSGDRS